MTPKRTSPGHLVTLAVITTLAAASLAAAQPTTYIASATAKLVTQASSKGSVDGTNASGALVGWAFDPASPSTPSTISIYMDGPRGTGRLIDSFPGNGPRPDVNLAFGITGKHGFSWQIPVSYQSRPHLWYVYQGGAGRSDALINGSPRVYPAIIASAVGSPQAIFTYATDKCSAVDIPDQPARAYRDAVGRVNLIASHYIVRRAVGDTLDSVVHQCAVIHESANDPVFGDFRYHEWLVAPYTLDGTTIYGYIHSEWYGNLARSACGGDTIDGWVNAITLAISHDGGASFRQPADYLVRYPVTPWRASFSCTPSHPTRYGDFNGTNIIARDGYYYKIFTYGSEPAVKPQQSGECLMRTNDLGGASSWEIWTGQGFMRSKTAPCFILPNLVNATSLTYNNYLKLYVAAEYIASRGFYFAVSPNLIDWSAPAPVSVGGLDPSSTPYSSLLDPADTSRNFENTGREPYLYYTQLHKGLDRDLMRVRIGFSYGR